MFWKRNQKTYFDYFEEHAQIIHESSKLLQQLFEPNANHYELSKKIKGYEHDADMIAHDAYNQMNTSSFILPIDHEDILLFLKSLDDVMDFIDDTAEAYAEIYQLNETNSFAKTFCVEILKGTALLQENCLFIREPSKKSHLILKNCKEIRLIENSADAIKKDALRQQFVLLKVSEISIAEYVAWNEIYHSLETITDKIEDCADIAEQFVMRYS